MSMSNIKDWQSYQALQKNTWGIREPVDNGITNPQLDLIIVPGTLLLLFMIPRSRV